MKPLLLMISLCAGAVCHSDGKIASPLADFLRAEKPSQDDRVLRLVFDVDADGAQEIFFTSLDVARKSQTPVWTVYRAASFHPERDGYLKMVARPVFDPKLSFVGLLDPLRPGEQGWILARLEGNQSEVFSAKLSVANSGLELEPLGQLDLESGEDMLVFKKFFSATAMPTLEDLTAGEWASMEDEYAIQNSASTFVRQKPRNQIEAGPQAEVRLVVQPTPAVGLNFEAAALILGLVSAVAVGMLGLMFCSKQNV